MEQGRRVPEGPTRAYLLVIDRDPKAVEKALGARPFRLVAADIQAAKNTASVAAIKNVDDIASARNG